jgi:hypothetical protein
MIRLTSYYPYFVILTIETQNKVLNSYTGFGTFVAWCLCGENKCHYGPMPQCTTKHSFKISSLFNKNLNIEK